MLGVIEEYGVTVPYGWLPSLVTVALVISSCSAGEDLGSTERADGLGTVGDLTTEDVVQPEVPWAPGTGYELTYTSTCGENGWISFEPVTVRVADGSIEVLDGPTPFEVATVERVLDVIDEAEAGGADSVEVEYGEHGQPMVVDIDWEADAIDDEFCLAVSDFKLIE